MKRGIVFIVLLLYTMFLVSCVSPYKSFDRIKSEYDSINTYSCDVIMQIKNNKSIQDYTLKQIYKSPDIYRIEILNPGDISGTIILMNENEKTFKYPKVEQRLIIKRNEGDNHPSIFFDMFNSKYGDIKNIRLDKNNNYLIDKEIVLNNGYMNKKTLWIDSKTGFPIKQEIYDMENNLIAICKFQNFKPNISIDEEMFK